MRFRILISREDDEMSGIDDVTAIVIDALAAKGIGVEAEICSNAIELIWDVEG